MLQCQPGRLPHVLVADDQPSIHEIVREELEPGRYRVSAASDGREAMRLLEADRPGLLVVDAVLPVIPGIEVAAHAVSRNVPVIVMTDEAAMDVRLARAGWPHLRKPFARQELLDEVHATIAQSQENSRIVRASLERLFHTSGDIRRTIDELVRLRQTTEAIMARARRLQLGH